MLNGISIKLGPLKMIGPILRPADASLANLEIPLTDAKTQTPNKSAADVKKRNQFILKADPRHAPLIGAAGIRLVSLGNNHCMDYRAAGLNQMAAALKKSGVLYAGAGANRGLALSPAVYVGRDGCRIGLISALAFVGDAAIGHCTPAGETTAGVGTLRFGGNIDKKARAELAAMFAEAKTRCDLLVVGLHWGIERQTTPTAYQVTLGRACIDAGADIVWGNHPHVLEGAELYNGKPILYSMGNLISSKGGATGLVKLVYDAGQFSYAQFLPLEIGGGRVKPVVGARAKAALREYQALGEVLGRRYPSKKSTPLINRSNGP